MSYKAGNRSGTLVRFVVEGPFVYEGQTKPFFFRTEPSFEEARPRTSSSIFLASSSHACGTVVRGDAGAGATGSGARAIARKSAADLPSSAAKMAVFLSASVLLRPTPSRTEASFS